MVEPSLRHCHRLLRLRRLHRQRLRLRLPIGRGGRRRARRRRSRRHRRLELPPSLEHAVVVHPAAAAALDTPVQVDCSHHQARVEQPPVERRPQDRNLLSHAHSANGLCAALTLCAPRRHDRHARVRVRVRQAVGRDDGSGQLERAGSAQQPAAVRLVELRLEFWGVVLSSEQQLKVRRHPSVLDPEGERVRVLPHHLVRAVRALVDLARWQVHRVRDCVVGLGLAPRREREEGRDGHERGGTLA